MRRLENTGREQAEDEQREALQAGLGEDDSTFDEALCDIYHQQSQLILQDETAASAAF